MELRRRTVDLLPLQAALADHETRLRQAAQEIAELRGELRVARDAEREARMSLRAEIDRLVDLIRGPQGAGGFENLVTRWRAAVEPMSAERIEAAQKASWYDEVHGRGIDQAEMIRRQKERELNGQ